MSILAKLCLISRESRTFALQPELENLLSPAVDSADDINNQIKQLHDQEIPLSIDTLNTLQSAETLAALTEASWVRLALLPYTSDNETLYKQVRKLALDKNANQNSRINAYLFLKSQNKDIESPLFANAIVPLVLSSENIGAWAILLSDKYCPENTLNTNAFPSDFNEEFRDFAFKTIAWMLENNANTALTKKVITHFASRSEQDPEITQQIATQLVDTAYESVFSPEKLRDLLSSLSLSPTQYNRLFTPYLIHVTPYFSSTNAFEPSPQTNAIMQMHHFFHPESISKNTSSDLSDISVNHDAEMFFSVLLNENTLKDLDALTTIFVTKIEEYKASSAQKRNSIIYKAGESEDEKSSRKNAVRVDSVNYKHLQNRYNELLLKAQGGNVEKEIEPKPATPVMTAEQIEQAQQQAFKLHDKLKNQLSEEQIIKLNKNPEFAKYSLAYRILIDIEAADKSKLRAVGEMFNSKNEPFGKEIKITFLIWIFENFDALNNSNVYEQAASADIELSQFPMIWQAFVACNPTSKNKTLSPDEKVAEVNKWLDNVLAGTTSNKTQDTIKALPRSIREALFADTKWAAPMLDHAASKKESQFTPATVFGVKIVSPTGQNLAAKYKI